MEFYFFSVRIYQTEFTETWIAKIAPRRAEIMNEKKAELRKLYLHRTFAIRYSFQSKRMSTSKFSPYFHSVPKKLYQRVQFAPNIHAPLNMHAHRKFLFLFSLQEEAWIIKKKLGKTG